MFYQHQSTQIRRLFIVTLLGISTLAPQLIADGSEQGEDSFLNLSTKSDDADLHPPLQRIEPYDTTLVTITKGCTVLTLGTCILLSNTYATNLLINSAWPGRSVSFEARLRSLGHSGAGYLGMAGGIYGLAEATPVDYSLIHWDQNSPLQKGAASLGVASTLLTATALPIALWKIWSHLRQ